MKTTVTMDMMSEFFVQDIGFKRVAQDMYATPFFTPEFCELLVTLGVSNPEAWGTNKDDRKYHTHDYVLKDHARPFYDAIDIELKARVWPTLEEVGWSFDFPDIRHMFMVSYSLDGQVDLKQHHDESYITGSIKLNSDYKGADIVFPRQKFKTEDIPVGHLLVWPGQITHPHYVTKLLDGDKFSLVIWTEWPA